MKLSHKLLPTLVLSLTLLTGSAWGVNLGQAKQQGYIGEKANGYVGLVDPSAPSDVKKLVNSTNTQRKSYYQSVAKNNGISLKEVERLAGRKTINGTASGQYIQRSSGQWEKK